jgi:hypothetical protein
MRPALAALAFAALAPAAIAQASVAPLKVGDIVDRLEMYPDRTVAFEPMADGRLRIVRLEDGNASAQVPRIAGQVGLAMSYIPELGTMLEFNNGLPWSFSYTADMAPAQGPTARLDVCPVGSDRVGSEQWPQALPRIVITGVKRFEGSLACAPG